MMDSSSIDTTTTIEADEDTVDAISKTTAIIRMIAGPISFIASMIIIILIMKSENRLKTTQNRLLTGLSVSDMLVSIALSIAHILKPKDIHGAWMAMGNMATCEAYGFVYIVSTSLAPMYNASLCIYYLLKIRYNVNDDVIKSRVEPLLHLVPLSIATTGAAYMLAQDYFNPGPAMCFFNDSPRGCTKNPDVPCERGEGVYKDWGVRSYILVIMVIVPVIIITSMISVVLSVRGQEQRMSAFGRGSLTLASSPASSQPRRGSITRRNRRRNQSLQVRLVMYRALAYALVWLLTFVFPFILLVQDLFTKSDSSDELRILIAIFTTLHGFWNFLVFIYPRVMHVRRLNPNFKLYQAVISAVFNPNPNPTPASATTPPRNGFNRRLLAMRQRIISSGDDDGNNQHRASAGDDNNSMVDDPSSSIVESNKGPVEEEKHSLKETEMWCEKEMNIKTIDEEESPAVELL